MHTGTVKWFDRRKGIGFITEADGNDIFVHFSAINMDGYKFLDDNQRVTYDRGDSEKGPTAVNVTVV